LKNLTLFLNACGVFHSNLNIYIKNYHKDLYNEIECRMAKLNVYIQFKYGTNKLQDISIFEWIYDGGILLLTMQNTWVNNLKVN
jgi:hypothetical protein